MESEKGQTETGHRVGKREGEVDGGVGEGIHRRETRSSTRAGGEQAVNEGPGGGRGWARTGKGGILESGLALKYTPREIPGVN